MAAQLLDFRECRTTPEAFAPAADRIISGDPQQEALNYYEGAAGRLLCGEWCCESGAWRLVYDDDEYEFCQMLEGHVRLTDASGVVREFREGDAFVIEAGFRGTWETLSYCRKHYVICRLS